MMPSRKQLLIFVTIALLLMLLAHRGYAGEPWSDSDRGRYATFLALQYADYRQTQQIAIDPDYIELNPILGENPSPKQVDAYFAAATIGHYLIADALKPQYRKLFIVVTTIAEAIVVNHNLNMGLRF